MFLQIGSSMWWTSLLPNFQNGASLRQPHAQIAQSDPALAGSTVSGDGWGFGTFEPYQPDGQALSGEHVAIWVGAVGPETRVVLVLGAPMFSMLQFQANGCWDGYVGTHRQNVHLFSSNFSFVCVF